MGMTAHSGTSANVIITPDSVDAQTIMNALTTADIAIMMTIGPWEPLCIADETNKPGRAYGTASSSK